MVDPTEAPKIKVPTCLLASKDEDVEDYALNSLVDNYAHLNIEDTPETSQSSQKDSQ